MKNRTVNLLLAVTILFVGITIGFSLGRNANHEPVQLSVFQKADATDGSALTAAAADTAAQTATVETSPPQETATQETTAPQTGPVNVNTADLSALMTLPGIGEVLAQRIIDYRETYGNFQSLEELINIKGIGTKRLEAILDYATIGG